jgi:hypothetical protein
MDRRRMAALNGQSPAPTHGTWSAAMLTMESAHRAGSVFNAAGYAPGPSPKGSTFVPAARRQERRREYEKRLITEWLE